MYCVALDPGGTTGICLVPTESEPWTVQVREIGPAPHHKELRRLLNLWQPEVVVCESFENRSQDAAILASAEYIGIVKAIVPYGRLHMQTANEGKTFWKDAKLKQYGLWVPGLRHARDAIRHYLYYRTFKRDPKDQSLLAGTLTGMVQSR